MEKMKLKWLQVTFKHRNNRIDSQLMEQIYINDDEALAPAYFSGGIRSSNGYKGCIIC